MHFAFSAHPDDFGRIPAAKKRQGHGLARRTRAAALAARAFYNHCMAHNDSHQC